jgi:hypothetical protein
MIFVFIGELTHWPNKIISRNRAYIAKIWYDAGTELLIPEGGYFMIGLP